MPSEVQQLKGWSSFVKLLPWFRKYDVKEKANRAAIDKIKASNDD
jgi:hypothetical protein